MLSVSLLVFYMKVCYVICITIRFLHESLPSRLYHYWSLHESLPCRLYHYWSLHESLPSRLYHMVSSPRFFCRPTLMPYRWAKPVHHCSFSWLYPVPLRTVTSVLAMDLYLQVHGSGLGSQWSLSQMDVTFCNTGLIQE